MATEHATTLLERERELGEARAALTEAHAARGRVVLVEAPAGLGKTSLLRAVAGLAADEGFICLRARASDLERAFAYGCVRQLLEPVVARASPADRDRLFEGAAALSEPLFSPGSGSAATSSPDSAFATLHGLYWLLNNLADQAPVVLFVDDLHWSDAESLRFVNYLAPRLDGLRVAVIGGTRPGEGETRELARLAAAPETTVLRPRPLSTAATATLCERRLGATVAPEFVAACRDATGGNPFYVEELLREAVEQDFATDAGGADRVQRIVPAAVAQAVLLRLAGRPPAATAVVRAVAVLGDGASLPEAASLAGLGEADAADAADVCVGLALLEPGLAFTHPIVREAVYADIGSRERVDAHARAAALLAERGVSEERIAAQIAQAEPAGDPARVVLLRRVAGEALVRGAPAAAVAWLGRALAEPPPPAERGEVLLELSSAELRLGTPGAAVGQLSEAAALVRGPELLATSARQLGAALTWSGDADRAVATIGTAIDAVGGEDRELTLMLEAERAAYAQQGSLEARAPVAAHLERYAGLEGATPGERLVLASLAFERARAAPTAAEAAGHIERALADPRLLGEQEQDVAGTLYLLVVGLLATDALDAADACLGRMLAEARARASIPALAFVIVHRGWVSFRRGDVADAEADARASLDLLTSHDIRLGTRFALALEIEALIERDEVAAADRALRESGFGDEIPAGMASNPLLRARSLLRLTQGRTREGLDDLVTFGDHDERWGGANPLSSRWRSAAALAQAALGDAEAARRLAVEDLDRARRWGAASGIGTALHALALVEGGDAAVERLREAAGILEGSPERLRQARALTDLGAALRRANRRAEARGALQDGLGLAERLGARALAARARTELQAAGGRSSDPYGTGVAQLTVSERRVAELAAEGHSNPEIAQALFVTRKTVETHLGRVYRKLDITGRRDLERVLADA